MLSGNTLVAEHGALPTTRRPRKFTHGFRLGVLAEVQAGTPLAQVARCHNIGEGLVWQWKKRYGNPLVANRYQPGSHRCYASGFIDMVVNHAQSGATQKASCTRYQIGRTTLLRWLGKRCAVPATEIRVTEPPTDAQLEQQLQALLEQYRALHTRIERIRQLVAAA